MAHDARISCPSSRIHRSGRVLRIGSSLLSPHGCSRNFSGFLPEQKSVEHPKRWGESPSCWPQGNPKSCLASVRTFGLQRCHPTRVHRGASGCVGTTLEPHRTCNAKHFHGRCETTAGARAPASFVTLSALAWDRIRSEHRNIFDVSSPEWYPLHPRYLWRAGTSLRSMGHGPSRRKAGMRRTPELAARLVARSLARARSSESPLMRLIPALVTL